MEQGIVEEKDGKVTWERGQTELFPFVWNVNGPTGTSYRLVYLCVEWNILHTKACQILVLGGGGISNRGKEKTEACMVKGEDGVVWPKGWEVSCKSCISLRVKFDNKEVGGC